MQKLWRGSGEARPGAKPASSLLQAGPRDQPRSCSELSREDPTASPQRWSLGSSQKTPGTTARSKVSQESLEARSHRSASASLPTALPVCYQEMSEDTRPGPHPGAALHASCAVMKDTSEAARASWASARDLQGVRRSKQAVPMSKGKAPQDL